MKCLFKVLTLSTFTLIFFACSENELVTQEELTTVETFNQQFTLTDKSTTSEDLDLYLEAKFDIENESLIGYKASEDLLTILDMDEKELDDFLRLEMGETFYLGESFAKSGHGSCVKDCRDTYTDAEGKKIKGRGRCIAGCWLRTAAAVLTAAAAVIAAL